MKPSLRVASATAMLAVLLSASVAGSSADPTPTPSDEPSGHTSSVRLVDSITSEPDQDRRTVSDWQEPSVALSEVSRLVPVLIEEHPENFSGVEIDLSGRWVNVFLVDPEGAGTDRLRDLAEEFGSELIKVVQVDTARADLDAAKDRIVSGEFGFVPTMSYVDPETGRVRVQLPDTSYRVADVDSVVIELFTDEPVVEVDGSEQPIASGIPELAQSIHMPAVAEELSVRLDVAVEKPLLIRPNNGPRHQSSVPFAAGAKIINYANSETCSASMPIALHGVRMIATAAHCTPYGTPNAN